MKISGVAVGLIAGVALGIVGTAFCVGPIRQASMRNNDPQFLHAGSNDRFEEYVICTGAVAVNPRSPTDGVWMMDHRNGKLLGTVIDRIQGKIVGWADLDLNKEFAIPAKQNAHFLMTTGTIAQGQAALYVAETTSGKFGVYTIGMDTTSGQGLVIRRHDLTTFRKAK